MKRLALSLEERVSTILEHGLQDLGRRAIAAKLGWTEKAARTALDYIRKPKETAEVVEPDEKKEKPKPIRITAIKEVQAAIEPGKVHRFILTSAQDDTPVFTPFWDNLLTYSAHTQAPILVAGFTYQKGLYEDHAAATAVFAQEVQPFLQFERVRFTNDLMFVADANVLPTVERPLSGWESVNGGNHAVIPSARVELVSLQRPQSKDPRFLLSTGCVTMPSYAPRASGMKSLAKHTFGAIFVEIDTDGAVFMRQLLADQYGSFQNLTDFVKDGVVYPACRVAAIRNGDIHHEMLDPVISLAALGYCTERKQAVTSDNMFDFLKPQFNVFDDTLDFRRRNHHNIDDPHLMAEAYSSGRDNVEDEIIEAASFLNEMHRDWCQTVMIESNHDSAIVKWTKDKKGQEDPANAYYWHALNAAWHKAIRERLNSFHLVEYAMRQAGLSEHIAFISSGSSLMVYGIENGFHGDFGGNGAKGAITGFARVGTPFNIAHGHTPCIRGLAWMCGVLAKMNQGYNTKGLTSWAHASTVQYVIGTRAMIVFSKDGRYRATGDIDSFQLYEAYLPDLEQEAA